MIKMQLLNNKLFDDNSFKCKTFTITPLDTGEYFFCEYDYIIRCFNKYVNEIKKLISQDKHYIQIPNCEIHWD